MMQIVGRHVTIQHARSLLKNLVWWRLSVHWINLLYLYKNVNMIWQKKLRSSQYESYYNWYWEEKLILFHFVYVIKMVWQTLLLKEMCILLLSLSTGFPFDTKYTSHWFPCLSSHLNSGNHSLSHKWNTGPCNVLI